MKFLKFILKDCRNLKYRRVYMNEHGQILMKTGKLICKHIIICCLFVNENPFLGFKVYRK